MPDAPQVLTSTRGIPAGERFTDGDTAFRRGVGRGLWTTLGFDRTGWVPGGSTVEWNATVDYSFPTAGGPVIQGGLVTAVLDSSMGGACWTVLDRNQSFLTADLRVEFLRSARPGMLRATGEVIRRTRRVIFCASELHDDEGTLLAAARCTQVVLPAEGRSGRYNLPPADES